MGQERLAYLSYLLRLWQTRSGDELVWRASLENARTGVRINALCPGCIDTPMLRTTMDRDPVIEKMIMSSLPGGRLGTPEEVAETAVWLCSDRASFVSGESMLVDGAAVAR